MQDWPKEAFTPKNQINPSIPFDRTPTCDRHRETQNARLQLLRKHSVALIINEQSSVLLFYGNSNLSASALEQMAVKLETLRRGSIADFSTATTSIGTTGYLPRRTRTAHVFLPPTARGLQQADPVSGEHRSTQHTIGRRS